MDVIVCGAGVIGAATAYFLAERGQRVTLVERAGVACAASGKSGGFLALDWCDGTPLGALARRSFALHEAFGASLGERTGYRRLTTYAGGSDGRARGGKGSVRWLADDVLITQRLGTAETTAQVHPRAFTEALVDAACARGAELVVGEVTGVRDGSPPEVEIDHAPRRADAVVLALGPWSMVAGQWLALPPVYGVKGHSLVFDTGDAVPAEALFLDTAYEGDRVTPEVFPRADGTTYVCAISSETPVPRDPAAVDADEGALERLEATCRALSPVLARSPIVARQACHRPVTADGLPLIGRAPGSRNVFVATGHSVWGILNGPATGEAIAELILDGRTRHVDLAAFDPGRLPCARRAVSAADAATA